MKTKVFDWYDVGTVDNYIELRNYSRIVKCIVFQKRMVSFYNIKRSMIGLSNYPLMKTL